MLSRIESAFIGLYLEWFLYGKISVLCALTCTLVKDLFPGPGLYSGIFAIYLQCPKKESRTAMIIFYVLCLLFVLSTATVVCDLLYIIVLGIYLDVSDNSICNLNIFYLSVVQEAQSPQLQIDMQSMLFRVHFLQITVDSCCDVIAQFILVLKPLHLSSV